MNMNVKLEGEEEQALQYVNRFEINIPSGAAAFNLNIVNPCLGNQSYILNPVSSVGQNIVTYQPSVALQSYIALPTESDGNILHGLPVGVPVPVGLPVSTSLLPNHNFVNTSIIIGNEDCNSGVLKSSQSNGNDGEIKIGYLQKPGDEITDENLEQVQAMGLNCSSHTNPDGLIEQKAYPMESNAKLPNSSVELEKFVSEIPMGIGNRNVKVQKEDIEKIYSKQEERDMIVKVPFHASSVRKDSRESDKKIKTEITWENDELKEKELSNEFHESLICEVEEVNDDEDEEDEDPDQEHDDNTTDNKYKRSSKKVESSSSEENDNLPLSIVFKLKEEEKNWCDVKKSRKNQRKNVLQDKDSKKKKKGVTYSKRRETMDENAEWSDSDEDLLNGTGSKNEDDGKWFSSASSESFATKSHPCLIIKVGDDGFKKFIRVRNCCSKKECAKKISVKDQKAAHKIFYDLESNDKRDAYLMNCIEHVQKNRNSEKENAKEDNFGNESSSFFPDRKQLLVNKSIQLEIENESNGNQKLSDEIQNAINESLKDCVVGENMDAVRKSQLETSKIEKNNWNFYVVVERCRKKVCLQFLLKLFQINKSRIKYIQKKILSGTPSPEELPFCTGNQRIPEIWEMAKSHVNTLICEECSDCQANPPHRFLFENRSREDLFLSFKKFFFVQTGKEPNLKFGAYKRFLDKETSLSFLPKKVGICTECEDLKNQQKRKDGKIRKLYSGCEKRKKWQAKTGSEMTSDDEPLLKSKNLKLTISLKGTKNGNIGKRNWKNSAADKRGRTKEKSKHSLNKGRDVWSLMLLHLETMPYKECKNCTSKKKHRFLQPTVTTQALFEDYRKYFLKETNSELGLGFTMYEKYFTRNCNYVIGDIGPNEVNCPKCVNQGSAS